MNLAIHVGPTSAHQNVKTELSICNEREDNLFPAKKKKKKCRSYNLGF